MEQLGLSQSTMAGIIKRLENKNLITRQTDIKDARKSILQPTKEGLALEEYLQETALQTEMILLQGMTGKEQAEFYRLLQIALDNMNRVRESESKKSGKKPLYGFEMR